MAFGHSGIFGEELIISNFSKVIYGAKFISDFLKYSAEWATAKFKLEDRKANIPSL